jgi:hypothetical protein
VHSLDSASEGNRYLGEKGVASVDEKDKDGDEVNQHPRPRQRLALPRDAAMGMGMDCPLAAMAVTMPYMLQGTWGAESAGPSVSAAAAPENVGKGWRQR